MLLQQNFVETEIATKFGKFNVRVYESASHEETVVLWTKNLSFTDPVLLRVHSECLTGDVIGSLQCDCGTQLNKSLHLISEQGGVLIYLRQEGRGIGLFEKMKAYKLQAEGYDTFEANVLLGHKPDERSYEMVKVALDDLKIKRVKILTNNPSKITEISEQGIEVVERVPLIVAPNEHNRKYFMTKEDKFQHSFSSKPKSYYYEFPCSDSEQLKDIAEFLEQFSLDPLLKIFVAITASPTSLSDAVEKQRINNILSACAKFDIFTPVLHYSFLESEDEAHDICAVKTQFPLADYVQLNDLKKIDFAFVKQASKMFKVVLPVPTVSFQALEDENLRRLVKKENITILLDDSQGNGVPVHLKSAQDKIQALLNYGINSIALAGGFGPGELEGYFYLKNYFKINFSIDAETKLRSGSSFDVAKIKKYLGELICGQKNDQVTGVSDRSLLASLMP
jgi:GTP cyclohydrolase II